MDETYDVVYWREDSKYRKLYVATRLTSLVHAKALRRVTGDLVVYSGTDKVVPNQAWLWSWEKDDETNYAFQHIKQAKYALRMCDL